MKIFLLFYMCHFAMGLTHCYKTTVFLNIYINNACVKLHSLPADTELPTLNNDCVRTTFKYFRHSNESLLCRKYLYVVRTQSLFNVGSSVSSVSNILLTRQPTKDTGAVTKYLRCTLGYFWKKDKAYNPNLIIHGLWTNVLRQ